MAFVAAVTSVLVALLVPHELGEGEVASLVGVVAGCSWLVQI